MKDVTEESLRAAFEDAEKKLARWQKDLGAINEREDPFVAAARYVFLNDAPKPENT